MRDFTGCLELSLLHLEMFNLGWALVNMAKGLLPFFIIFGGAIPYIPQYLEIKRLKSSDGFSPYVCLSLTIANLLRIGFWFGQPFPLPLLLQAFLMVFAMMFMMHVWVKYRQIPPFDGGEHVFSDLDWRYFWRWSNYESYVKFVILFSLVFGVPCFAFSSSYYFVQAIGFVSLITEALLALPQFLQNCRHSSTVGMSLEMVLMWTVGDLFKTIYFFLSKAPVQFPICGCTQLAFDFAIFFQFLAYRRRHSHIGPDA
ncbi:Solute carrier family 66 member 2 [Taenia crassiceps]|uniref:Solute carrier family 66 member 2 n=1 Tax=Taenia crassiceps TaxID=6207 RepID=A0ABR4Q950_9CEST